MKKILLALSGTALLGASAFAIGPTLTINGKTVEKNVTRITFEGDNAILHFGSETESHDMNTVVLSFNALSGIDEIIGYSFNGIIDGNIELGGIPSGTTVEIFDASGRKRVAHVISTDPARIDVSQLEPGIYVLRAGKNAVKFLK